MPPQWLSYTPDEKTNILQTIVNSAAKEGFPLRRPEIRKPYLSNTTFQLVEKLASLTQPSQAEQRRLLRNRVKKMAKRDKKVWWNLKFCQDHRSHPSQQWKSVKQVRSNFAPRPANIRDIRGVLRPSSSRPEVFAEYLQTQVWAPKNLPALGTQTLPQTLIPSTIGPIQFSELQQALALLKVGKSPGPDELSAELLKYSSIKFQALLLSLFSDCFLGENFLCGDVVEKCIQTGNSIDELSAHFPHHINVQALRNGFEKPASTLHRPASPSYPVWFSPSPFGLPTYSYS